MAEARDKAAWRRTFAVMAAIHNANCTDRAALVNWREFFPWGERAAVMEAPPPTPEERKMLRERFPGK